MRKSLCVLLCLCACVLACAGCVPNPAAQTTFTTPSPSLSPAPSPSVPDAEESYDVGGVMPDFTLTLLGGREFTLSEHRGRVVVINIFATWCGPCVREMPDLQQLYDEFGDTVDFLLLDGDFTETADQVQDFLTDHNLTLPAACLPKDAWSGYTIEFFPQTFVIDTQGVIHAFFAGLSTYENFKDAIESAP